MNTVKNHKEAIKEILKVNPYLSNREIGKMLGLSRGTVQYHIKNLGISRDRKLLQQLNNTKRSFDIPISKEAEQLILGSILGDGTVSKWIRTENSKKNLNSYVGCAHTSPQLEYLLYKKQLFESFNIKCQKIQKIPKEKLLVLCPTIQNKVYTVNDRYQLNTRRAVTLNKYRDLFYNKHTNKKYINRYIYKLNPLGLAIWYMDDGTKSGNSYKFSTHCFNMRSLHILQDMLKRNFNIETSINITRKHPKIQYTLYVKRKSTNTLTKLILPYICDSMKYKLQPLTED